jgi:hypothetical protein
MPIASKKLVEKIKPLLSDSAIADLNIRLDKGDCGRIVVEFILTKEILKAMAEIE